MVDNVTKDKTESIKPPVTSVGVLGWIKANLFNGWFNSILTVVTLFLLWKIIPPFIRWAFIDSLWYSTSAECREVSGACWSIIPSNLRFMLFGFYPYEEQWRPLLAMVLLIGLLFLFPLAWGLFGALMGGLFGKAADVGIDNKFIKEVGNSLEPGNSALFLLVIEATEDKVIEDMAKMGGHLYQTSLSKEDEETLRQALEHADIRGAAGEVLELEESEDSAG